MTLTEKTKDIPENAKAAAAQRKRHVEAAQHKAQKKAQERIGEARERVAAQKARHTS